MTQKMYFPSKNELSSPIPFGPEMEIIWTPEKSLHLNKFLSKMICYN